MIGVVVYRPSGPITVPDSIMRRQTFIFGMPNPGPVHSPDVVRHKEHSVGRDQRTNIIYPASRLTIDGYGRQVADVNYTEAPDDQWLF